MNLPDGTKVAAVTLKTPTARIVVTNRAAFARWVNVQWPDECELTVRPSFEKTLLARFAAEGDTGDVFDTKTGEQVEGVTAYEKPDEATSIHLSFVCGLAGFGRAEIARQWRAGGLSVRDALPELEGGGQ